MCRVDGEYGVVEVTLKTESNRQPKLAVELSHRMQGMILNIQVQAPLCGVET